MVVPADKSRAPPAEPSLTKNERTMLSILVAAGRTGLTTKAWYQRAKDAGLNPKRPADLFDLIEALKAKNLAVQSGEQCIAAGYVQQEGLFE
jgi:hypothetical protein